jgi:outer membrane protein assembly factor BamD
MKNITILYISAVLIIVFSACTGIRKVVKGTDYNLKYTEARRYYNKGDYYKAQTLYDQIAPIFRGTDKADTVYYYQAMSYYMQSDYIWRGIIFRHSQEPMAPVILFRKPIL